jgi:2-aminoadipate transaminase
MNTTTALFAERMGCIPESFIREILKVAAQKDVISFAGGLPNPHFFPVKAMAAAAEKVLQTDGRSVLQYAPTDGYLPLRDYLAQRQSGKEGRSIAAEDVIILNGSQQGIDLAGKIFLDKATTVLMEEPSYLGAIQAFSAYQPTFRTVRLNHDGPDLTDFINKTRKYDPKLFYCIPNFQNPTGRTYSTQRRIELMESSLHNDMLWIEDNPYGDICFDDQQRPDLHAIMPHKTIHLGSFSKIISPGLRLGWATGPRDIIKKMVIAKQASDLHSNNLAQRIVYQFLLDNSIEDHLTGIRNFYQEQATHMISLMKQHFPPEASWSEPSGGMFIWVTLPDTIGTADILRKCMEHKVIFVPGENFFINPDNGRNTMRLNFSNPSREEMKKGLSVLGKILYACR